MLKPVPVCLRMFLSSPRVAWKEEQADHFVALAGELTFPVKQEALYHSVRFLLSSRFRRDYSGSAAIPNEDGVKETLSPPLHESVISSVTYSQTLL
jgi:hypothetical protein